LVPVFVLSCCATLLCSVPNAAAYASGTVSIVSYPSTFSSSTYSFTVTTHAQWSGLNPEEYVLVGLNLAPTYDFGGFANEITFTPSCQSSCRSSSSSGELDSAFTVSGSQSTPGYSYYGFPNGFTLYATLETCIPSGSCTTITNSQPVIIGTLCTLSGQGGCVNP
jgi:hypothetical protein